MASATTKTTYNFSNEIKENSISYLIALEIEKKAKLSTKNRLESLITIYLDECLKYVKTNKETTKDGLPYSYNATVSKFKAELIKAIDSDIKEASINNPSLIAFNVFNKAMKKAPEKLLIKLRLMDYATIKKFSELTPSLIKGLNFKNDYTTLTNDIKEAYKSIADVKAIESHTKALEKKGFTVSN